MGSVYVFIAQCCLVILYNTMDAQVHVCALMSHSNATVRLHLLIANHYIVLNYNNAGPCMGYPGEETLLQG